MCLDGRCVVHVRERDDCFPLGAVRDNWGLLSELRDLAGRKHRGPIARLLFAQPVVAADVVLPAGLERLSDAPAFLLNRPGRDQLAVLPVQGDHLLVVLEQLAAGIAVHPGHLGKPRTRRGGSERRLLALAALPLDHLAAGLPLAALAGLEELVLVAGTAGDLRRAWTDADQVVAALRLDDVLAAL